MGSVKKDVNHLPESVGTGFLKELTDLVSDLAPLGFREGYLKSELLSKYSDPSTTPPDVRRQAAIQKWLSAEDNNRKSNLRIPFGEDFGWTHSDEIFGFARKLIANVLGPIEDVDDLCVSKFSNGASTRIRRSELAAILKHSGQAHATEDARLQWSLAVKDTALEDQEVDTVFGSELFTVPKKTDIDRVACKEPEINQYLQRAVGIHISRRLRRRGIDLTDQSRNQELARIAVEEGLATIDLSSASDSISRQIVFELLPFDWWSYLDSIRCKSVLIDGAWHEFEMFSSMGNGFTFELETLIFWALTHSVKKVSGVRGVVSVYGDDIIAPSMIVPRLSRFFSWVGFTVNLSKSFWRGHFRESCGKHYYRGWDVSPFFVRGPIQTKTDLIRLLNRLMEWSSRDWGFITDPRVGEFHRKWSNRIPQELWGGQDPDDVSSLVTGHPPRRRLVRESSNKSEFLRRSGLEHCRFTRWLTLKEVSIRSLSEMRDIDEDFEGYTLERAPVGNCLQVVPSKLGKFVLDEQPEWTTRTAWTPWLVFPGCGGSG
jgi:hypothetical protein